MRKASIILSRFDSKRLSGKALINIAGKELIAHCIDSLSLSDKYEMVIATTTRTVDNPIIDFALKNGIKYFRGDTENVAKRVLDCISFHSIDIFARINGDSPFVQRNLLIDGFNKIENENFEFVTNLMPRAFPYGISVEIIKSSTYIQNFKNFTSDIHKEHITSYFYENIKNFNYYNINYNNGNDHDVRLVVDTIEDKNNIEQILNNLHKDQQPTLQELIREYRKLNL